MVYSALSSAVKERVHKTIYSFFKNYLDKIKNNVDIINLYKDNQILKNIGLNLLDKNDFLQPNTIEYQANENELNLMVEHVKKIWTEYGNNDPFWSVITSEKFRLEKIESTKDEFYSSGKNTCLQFIECLKRNDFIISKNMTCLELGCGTGRVTAHLATYFDKVLACDISKPHIKLAEENLKDIKNIEYINVVTPNELLDIKKVDVIFTVIVLQHNTPPLIHEYIKNLLSILKNGGVAYFQVPTYKKNYSFSIKKYLNNLDRYKTMEMHAIPQQAIFSLIEKNNCITYEVREDTWVGDLITISNTFLVKKK